MFFIYYVIICVSLVWKIIISLQRVDLHDCEPSTAGNSLGFMWRGIYTIINNMRWKEEVNLESIFWLYQEPSCNPLSTVWYVAVSQGGGWTVWAGSSLQGWLLQHLEPRGVGGAAKLHNSPFLPGGGKQKLWWRGKEATTGQFQLRLFLPRRF